LAGLTILSLFVFTISPLTAGATTNPYGNDEVKKISLCHDEAGDGTGYHSSGGIDVNAAISGHDGHETDIIPPFYYKDGNSTVFYAGKNWTDVNEDIWNNGGCDGDGILDPVFDLSISKTVGDGLENIVADSGTNVVFTVIVSNAGPDTDSNVVVNDVLPAGLTYVSSSATQGSYSSGVWTVGSLADDSSATLTVTATATGSDDQILTNTATVDNESDSATVTVNVPVTGCTNPEANNYNQNATVDDGSCTFDAHFDLSITKTVVDGENNIQNINVDSGTNATFTITVSNSGPDTAPGVMVNDLLPAGLTYVSSNTVTGTYDSGTGIWSVGDLAASATASLTITATAAGEPATVLTNTASTTDSNTDDSNDSDSATVTINTPDQNDVSGCMDRTAINFNADATIDDGTCQYTLTITTSGTGDGVVSGDDIHCDSNSEENICSFVYDEGTSVDLTVTPDSGSNFNGTWSTTSGSPVTNTCTGNNTSCAVTINGNITLNAHFAKNTSGGGGHSGGGSSSTNGSVAGANITAPAPTPTPQVLGAALPVTGTSADLMIMVVILAFAPLVTKLNKRLKV